MLRRLLRTALVFALLLILPACVAVAQPPAALVNPGAVAADAPLNPDSPIDDILDALDARGKTLKDFSADVRLTSTDNDLQTSESTDGAVLFQRLPDSDARVKVGFTKHTVGKRTTADRVDYLLEKGWLTDRNYQKKLEVQRQVLHPGQKINLLKLGEGPFPLPIGQDKADVHAQFDVKKIAPAKTDPAGTVHVQLTPKPGTPLARKFDTIDVWADLKTKMPVRIETLHGSDDHTTDLTNIKLNPGLKDSDFALPAIDATWSQRQEPFAN